MDQINEKNDEIYNIYSSSLEKLKTVMMELDRIPEDKNINYRYRLDNNFEPINPESISRNDPYILETRFTNYQSMLDILNNKKIMNRIGSPIERQINGLSVVLPFIHSLSILSIPNINAAIKIIENYRDLNKKINIYFNSKLNLVFLTTLNRNEFKIKYLSLLQ